MAGKDAIYEAMIYQACDRLLAARKRVSLRNLIAALPNGGTNRIVGPVLRDWKVDRDYKPRLVVNDLPEALQAELVLFTRAVVEAAQASQAAHFTNDRKKLEARLRANDELRDDALTECDFLREENIRLTREAAEVLKLRTENEQMRRRLDRIRAEEFWDRVMAEVAEMMPVGGSRPLDEILAGLKDSIHRRARLHKEPLDVDTLKKKMIGRWGTGSFSRRLRTAPSCARPDKRLFRSRGERNNGIFPGVTGRVMASEGAGHRCRSHRHQSPSMRTAPPSLKTNRMC